ncbi:hypothetical protein V6V47_10830 [Micromonospora sp. CPCC 205539]|uniref:hypothetical protein n=1 Tax=Micromonospora sp. CPCC 205539 TaxID=3122408 RepID=UPI002FF22AF6
MNPHRPDRPADRAETERLLDANRADTPAGPDTALARLIAAAAGPARPGELAGEQAALAAFRAARADPTPTAAGRPHRRRLTTGLSAWIGAVAVTATAGAAFAAVTLDRTPVPAPPATSSPRPTPAVARPSSDDRTDPPSRPTAPGTGSAPTGPPSATGTPSVGPVPGKQLHRLCRTWLAKAPKQREKALSKRPYQDLVAAAGGADEVEAYCQGLIPEAQPAGPPTLTPSPPKPGRPDRD